MDPAPAPKEKPSWLQPSSGSLPVALLGFLFELFLDQLLYVFRVSDDDQESPFSIDLLP